MIWSLFLCAVLSLFLLGCATSKVKCSNDRFAEKLAMDGVPNLHRLNENIYRSAQPNVEGFANLEKMGIKTVICLRTDYADVWPSANTLVRCRYVHINPLWIDENEVVEVLKMLKRTQEAPFLIHCRHGADRTGLICAAYRIVFENWTKEDAIAEMREGGFGFHPILENVVVFLRYMDVEAVRKQVGVFDKK